MTSIFEGQTPKTKPFPIKARVIWVPGHMRSDNGTVFVLDTCSISISSFSTSVILRSKDKQLRCNTCKKNGTAATKGLNNKKYTPCLQDLPFKIHQNTLSNYLSSFTYFLPTNFSPTHPWWVNFSPRWPTVQAAELSHLPTKNGGGFGFLRREKQHLGDGGREES